MPRTAKPKSLTKSRRAIGGKKASANVDLRKPQALAKRWTGEQTEALARLKVDALELARAPEIGEMLQQSEGGIETVLKAARFSKDASVQRFLEAFDDAAEDDRKALPIEAFAMAAGLDLLQLLGALVMALREASVNIVKIMAISSHPETMKARIDSAKLLGAEGVRDRNALDTAMRFLPASQKGPTIMFKMGEGHTVTVDSEDGDEEADPDTVFPGLLSTQKLLED